jgi:PAS domain S-box-containing protein
MNESRKTLAYFQELFELAPAAYIVTDAHCVIQDANSAAGRLLRKPLVQLVGKPLEMFIEPGERAVFREMVSESLIARKQLVQPLSLQPAPGEDVEVLYSAAVVHDGKGNVTALHWLLIEGFDGGQGDLL